MYVTVPFLLLPAKLFCEVFGMSDDHCEYQNRSKYYQYHLSSHKILPHENFPKKCLCCPVPTLDFSYLYIFVANKPKEHIHSHD